MNKYPKVIFLGEQCSVEFHLYENAQVAIQLICEDGSPMAYATVNVPEYSLQPGHVLIKSWSENEGMLEALVKAGFVQDTGMKISCGFCHANLAKLLIHP